MDELEIQREIRETQLRKLKLQIESLESRNRLIGRLARLGSILLVAATVAATLVAVFTTIFGVWHETTKQRELRMKELSERSDNQYRADIQQLLRYPIDENQTIPLVVFILNDLSSVVEKGHPVENLENRKSETGTLLAKLIGSSQFELSKPRNVEFDLTALTFCKYYTDALINAPKDNKVILEKYRVALEPFHREYKISELVRKRPGAESTFELIKPYLKFEKEGFTPRLRPFVAMVKNYELHVDLLRQSLQGNQQNADKINRAIDGAFCDFYLSTNNIDLARDIFKISDQEAHERMLKCTQFE